MTTTSPRPATEWVHRAFVVGFDAVLGVVIVGALTTFVISVLSPAPAGLLALVGIWTGISSLASLPALALLYKAAPRVPLAQRSALFASAAWFGRAVWSAIVLVFSVIVGAIAGVLASRATDVGSDLGEAIELTFASTSQLLVWPILAAVIAIAFAIMGVRWLFDLDWLANSSEGSTTFEWFERRWFPTREPMGVRSRAVLLEGAVRIGQVALALTMITIGLAVASAVTRSLG